MRRWLIGCGALSQVLLCNAQQATAQVEAKQSLIAQDRAAQVDLILAEYQAAQSEFSLKMREVATDKERQRFFLESSPRQGEYLARLWPLVDAAPTDPSSLKVLVWAGKEQIPAEDQKHALSLLLEHYADTPQILEVVDRVAPTLSATRFLEGLLENSKSREIQARATYRLSRTLGHLEDLVRMKGKMASMYDEDLREGMMAELQLVLGEETLAWVETADLRSLDSRRKKLLETVIADYSDVKVHGKSLAATARGDLKELRTLAVGKMAPEIEGTDIDGVAFKLSDYRGKVVMLDFWGHW